MKRNKAFIAALLLIASTAHAQAWRDCVRNSIGHGGCESIGPGGGMSIGPGGGQSIGPGGGQSIGPGGGRSLDNPRGLNPNTMRHYGQ
jgi:hypothetical protein